MFENHILKAEILSLYGVQKTQCFQPDKAIDERVAYLKNFLRRTKRKAYILGISGGVDSTVAGKLCQIACTQLREEGYTAQFVAMRLPAGVQTDESDAQRALDFIKPDITLTVNVGPASNQIHSQAVEEFMAHTSGAKPPELTDFHKGNVKARMRMLAQYEQAAFFEGLVVGTDHNAEAVMGFFTIFGDGACDLTVLNGLNKRQIRIMAKSLGASSVLWDKPAMADLEDLKPGQLDDEGFGFDYEYLNDFLEGGDVPQEIEEMILARYDATRFKRGRIPGFVEQ